MRIMFAAFLSSLAIAPVLAAGSSSMHVGLVVTGNFVSPLAGTWDSRTRATNAIYRFELGRTSGVFYELVSVPLREGAAVAAVGEGCDLRVTGMIYSADDASETAARSLGDRQYLKPDYELRYSVQSANAVVSSSANLDGCERVAASYMSDSATAGTTQTLFLSRAADGSLVDSIVGTEYARASR